jgi:hypothetical protein
MPSLLQFLLATHIHPKERYINIICLANTVIIVGYQTRPDHQPLAAHIISTNNIQAVVPTKPITKTVVRRLGFRKHGIGKAKAKYS